VLLPAHYSAFIRLHHPLRRRLLITSRFFQSLLLSWLCVTYLLVLSGATDLQERWRWDLGSKHWAWAVQDVFFVGLGTLGLVLCFGLLAQLSRQWGGLVSRWHALPANIACPHPETHAALLTYLATDSTGYVILGQVITFAHAAFFNIVLGIAVLLILLLRKDNIQ
jgi:hypothetical protein